MPERGLPERIYSRLLRLYPREFRERFGGEMTQNFADLSKERGLISKWLRVAWLFSDALLQAGRENVFEFRRGRTMKEVSTTNRLGAIVGILCTLPGAIVVVLLVLGIEPPFARFFDTTGEGPAVLGSLVVFSLIVVIPFLGVMASAIMRTEIKPAFDIGMAVAIGLIVVLPLIALQSTVGRASYRTFPTPLFVAIWILGAVFTVVVIPTVRAIRNGDGSALAYSGMLISRVVFLLMIGAFLTGLVSDQMPCFLGVPNCD